MAKNSNFHNAKSAKNDEFYTQLTDIEKEMAHYKEFFNGKVVYCNCDDARESNFFKYFSLNFEHLGLKKLICTGYKADGKGVVLTYEGDKNGNRKVDDEEVEVRELNGNGDFRSEECIEFLKECDVVVTNPPFSLFREYVAQLMEYEKKFIIIGNGGAATYEEIFPLIKNNEIWYGATYFNGGAAYFYGDASVFDPSKISSEKHAYIKDGKLYWRVNGVRWFTNVDHNKRNTPLDLYKTYSEKEYPKFDTYDAINVNKVVEIPTDYNGVMGVPFSFLDKYCPTQFEIVGKLNHNRPQSYDFGKSIVNGKEIYARLLIRKKDSE